MGEEKESAVLSGKRMRSYNAKKRALVTAVAVALGVAALCFSSSNATVTMISLPIIIAAAFTVDKILIITRPDVFGKDMLKRGRSPVIATCTVVCVFTAICLVSGIAGYQLAMYTAANANVVETFDDIDGAIEFLQKTDLDDDYTITVHMNNNGKDEFRITADFVPKSGKYDEDDFKKYKDYEINGNVVTVTLRAYNLEYNGEKIAYYALNEKHPNAKIEIKDGAVKVVDYGQVFGIVLGAAFGAVAQVAILIVVYIVGIIAAIVPSEIYFEKLIRNEAKKAELATEK